MKPAPLPQVIIFDLGGVFMKNPLFFTNEQFQRERGIDPSSVRSLNKDKKFHEFERGEISGEEFFEYARSALGYTHNYQTFRKDFCAGFEPDLEMFDFFNKLKPLYGGVVTFSLLSNLNEIHYEHLLEHHPGLHDSFHPLFFSHQRKCRKPDPEIYDLVIAECRVSPDNCLFIDDLEINGEYPERIKMRFIHFRGLPELKTALGSYGIKVDEP